jgi:hypothetical protein
LPTLRQTLLGLAVLALLVPLAGANAQTGAGVGQYSGCSITPTGHPVSAAQAGGGAIAFSVLNTGGSAVTDTLQLTWIHLYPTDEYDLWLYAATPPDATGRYQIAGDPSHPLAVSENRYGAPQALTYTFAPGQYYIAFVVPFFAFGDPFSLSSSTVTLGPGLAHGALQAPGPGYEYQEWAGGCPA